MLGEWYETPNTSEITHTDHTPPLASSTCHTSPPTPPSLHPALGGVDVQIRWLLGAMAVEPGLLDIGDGLGSSGDAWDAAEPPNKPVSVVGGV